MLTESGCNSPDHVIENHGNKTPKICGIDAEFAYWYTEHQGHVPLMPILGHGLWCTLITQGYPGTILAKINFKVTRVYFHNRSNISFWRKPRGNKTVLPSLPIA
ncbi:hypothetical protein GDO81_006066 [Engystomops pustulosus]|uniref:Uncharacterized protein n=1 Tax=Engystomops pustulosus TaxID=76066 RepID=A0AAV7CU98_ENGPU|nr:hypothetical protein GDO81_006066 [Engystomops pustulosus]